MAEMEKLYTVKEASNLPWLGLKYWTLWDYLKKGKIVKTRVGGKVMIRESELEKLIVDCPPSPPLIVREALNEKGIFTTPEEVKAAADYIKTHAEWRKAQSSTVGCYEHFISQLECSR